MWTATGFPDVAYSGWAAVGWSFKMLMAAGQGPSIPESSIEAIALIAWLCQHHYGFESGNAQSSFFS
jgi:hypothetical protein